jgi:predicted dehydrogenase
VRSIAAGAPLGPTVEDAVRAAELLDAITTSSATGSWVRVEP